MSVIAYHLIWTNYGTWLANDPRGSGSREVRSPALAALSEVHFGRRSVQPARRAVREFYEAAEPRLQFPIVRFAADQIAEVGAAIESSIRRRAYTCYACAIMPDHVHLVIRKHRDTAEAMIEHLQADSRASLRAIGITTDDHPIWTKHGWRVFLNSPDDVRGRIRYVENNPVKEELPRQNWPFVAPYDNWPLHKKLNRKR